MDGVIVAYHNTDRIFGFQYIPLLEMDKRLFGPEAGLGQKVFDKCIGLLEAILPVAAECYPKQVCVPLLFTWFFYMLIIHLECPVYIRDGVAW